MGNKGSIHRDGRSISFPSAELKAVPNIVYQLEASQVGSLDVSDNYIINLEPLLFNFKFLTVLKLNNNRLTKIPDEIENLSRLVELDLSSNMLQDLTDSVGMLRKLVRLNLNNNPNIRLPASGSIWKCRSLIELRISNCSLKALPEAIEECTQLQVFEARGNSLRRLPRSIHRLVSLTTLDLGENRLRGVEVAFKLHKFRHLEVLRMDHTQLGCPLLATNPCAALRIIDYSNNNMRENFRHFEPWQYPALVELDISASNIQQLPGDWAGAVQLKRILAQENMINRLPSSLWQCSQLEALHFQENMLTDIPSGIGNLSRLRVFTLDSNNLTLFPREATMCISLELLSLDNNRIPTAIPDTVPRWPRLRIQLTYARCR